MSENNLMRNFEGKIAPLSPTLYPQGDLPSTNPQTINMPNYDFNYNRVGNADLICLI